MVKNKGEEETSLRRYLARPVFVKFIFLIIIGFFMIFFLSERYTNYTLVFYLASLIFMLFGYYFWDKEFFDFLIFALVSITSFIALEISFNLGFYFNFLIALLLGLIFAYSYVNKRTTGSYALLLLSGFIIIWSILGFNVSYRHDWVLENLINIPFVLILLIVSRWFRFSKASYSLFYLYMFMNTVGSHYTYSEVPFGFWLSTLFELGRNHYDRIIHFCFGLLLAYPMREVYVRIGNYKGIWALFAPITMVFALSGIYEILEWQIALMFGGDLGIAYLGTQGDVWDAQKDMLLAGLGSIFTMAMVFFMLIIKRGKLYAYEIGSSFYVNKDREKADIISDFDSVEEVQPQEKVETIPVKKPEVVKPTKFKKK